MAAYVAILDADVVGLQEINSIGAVHRVFDPEEYKVFIDGRRDADLAGGLKPEAEGGASAGATDGIYVGLAVRRGRVTVVSVQDFEELSVLHEVAGEPPRPTRRGLQAVLEVDGVRFTVLVIHLKSGCPTGSLAPTAADPDCPTLGTNRLFRSQPDACTNGLGVGAFRVCRGGRCSCSGCIRRHQIVRPLSERSPIAAVAGSSRPTATPKAAGLDWVGVARRSRSTIRRRGAGDRWPGDTAVRRAGWKPDVASTLVGL